MARFDFELKLIRKTLMNRYPWIKDVKDDPETSKKNDIQQIHRHLL